MVHSIAQQGFGKGTNELYDRARPSYQSNAIALIRSSIRSAPPLNVVEIGSGTGLFTRAFLAHPECKNDIRELKAFEPSAGMREVFAKTVQDERVSIQDGSFDATGVEDGWADLVVIAQAFHWAPDYDRASAEFARILKPSGIVAFIWNLEDRDSAKWVASLRNRIEQHENGSPQFRLGLWRQTFETPSYQKSFEPPEENVFSYALETTTELTVERACSKSYIAILPGEEKEKVVEDVKAILEKGEDKEWIDEDKDIFKYPYKTFVVISRRK